MMDCHHAINTAAHGMIDCHHAVNTAAHRMMDYDQSSIHMNVLKLFAPFQSLFTNVKK